MIQEHVYLRVRQEDWAHVQAALRAALDAKKVERLDFVPPSGKPSKHPVVGVAPIRYVGPQMFLQVHGATVTYKDGRRSRKLDISTCAGASGGPIAIGSFKNGELYTISMEDFAKAAISAYTRKEKEGKS